MKITIDKVQISDFMNIKQTELQFSEGFNTIRGRNGAGKSNILNAIIWCLFGKNFEDKKKFEIIPLNSDQSRQKVDPTVTLTIKVDDRTYELKRQVKGSATNCEIDGAPKKVGDYDSFVANIFGSEDRFKMFTMPLYFPESLHWTKQRELLMAFFPDPEPSMVFGLWARETKQILWEKAFVVAMEKISPTDYMAKHEKELKECETRKAKIDAQIELLDKQLEGNHEFSAESLDDERAALRAKIAEYTETVKLTNDFNMKLAKAISLLNQQRLDTMAEMGKIKRMAEAQRAGDLAALHRKLHDAESYLLECRRKYAEIKNTHDDAVCKTCGQAIPEHALAAAAESRAAQLAQLAIDGAAANKTVKALKDQIEQTETASIIIDIKDLQAKVDAIELKLNQAPAPKEIPNQDPEIYKRMDELDRALARADVHQENIKRRQDLEADERKINTEIEEHTREIWTAGQYIYYRSKVIVDQVNQQFKNISVKIFDTQKNGVTKETFEITSDGVPYSDLNTAGKLQAGLELTSFLKSALGIETTVFIDNGERYTDVEIGDIKGQVIATWATKGSPLKVEVA